ncbi:PREDICTED: uncharacterized protein LOC109181268 [Ipomoea nil]|uniref:uncharacterized protein LOC109181268 n=1 Tax=Ipomoea nil TaxID=35883 RepID=UPI0009018164|nr:PREDICTED: uncharacterized protein LOC109181268 [Ipomoea nil]
MVSELHRSYAAVVVMDNSSSGNQAHHIAASSSQNLMNQRSDDVDDPLYLHISENPNLILVSPPLSEINYTSWSRSMRIALEVKNKFSFVDGSVACPEESDPKIAAWRRSNRLVCSWILKSLNPTIAESIMYFDRASDIWKALNKRCSCTLMARMQKERDNDQVIRFLEGLNDEYETIKSDVLVMDPMPEMEKVLNMTLKVERKIKGSVSQRNIDIIQSNAIQNNQAQSEEELNVVAMSSSNTRKKFNNNGGKNVPKCTSVV